MNDFWQNIQAERIDDELNRRGNHLFRIDRIAMAVSVDDDGEEGVCAIEIRGMMVPLIAADENRMPFIRDAARMLAKRDHRLIRIIGLSVREEIEQIDERV